MKAMKGSDYVARVRLSDAENKTLALPGKTCEKVPESSLPWLLKQKMVERIKDRRKDQE
ncbi:MAG TPA: hypothetical protein VNJ03_14970 [Vicinamibacterales bacterium]|nr:hypothetical protein [Vicinamibacterales bacterium]